MNHLESSFTGKNDLWRYIIILGAVLVAANTVGSIPLIIAYTAKTLSDPAIISDIASNPNDMSVLGLDPNIYFLVMIIPFLASLLTFALLVKPLNNRKFKTIINGTSNVRWNRMLISGVVWLVLSAIYFIIYIKVEPSNFTFNNTSFSSLIILVLISLIFIPFQAAFEEVIFRGYLMQGFTVISKNRWFPLLMTSLLFGLMHSFNPEVKAYGFLTMMPQYVVFGLVFGIISIMDDGIEVSVGAHAANNIFLCIMVTNSSSALQTPAVFEQHNIFPWTEFSALLVTGILFILILRRIFKWQDYSVIGSKVEPAENVTQTPYTEVLSSLR